MDEDWWDDSLLDPKPRYWTCSCGMSNEIGSGGCEDCGADEPSLKTPSLPTSDRIVR